MTPTQAEAALSALNDTQITAAVAVLAEKTPGITYFSGPMSDTLINNLAGRGVDQVKAKEIIQGMFLMTDTIMVDELGSGTASLTGVTDKDAENGDWEVEFVAHATQIDINAETAAAMSVLGLLPVDDLRKVLSRLVDKTPMCYISVPFREKIPVTKGLMFLGNALCDVIAPEESVKLNMLLMRPGQTQGCMVQSVIQRNTPQPEKTADEDLSGYTA